MPPLIQRFLHLRAGEARVVLALGLIILGNSLAQKISEIVSVSNFISDIGAAQFLIVLIVSSAISLVVTGFQSLLVDRYDRIKLLRTIGLLLAIAFVVLRLLFYVQAPHWLTYGLFYLLSDQQLVFFPMAFWVLAIDVLDVAQGKRLFPLLASFGFVGNLLGIGITACSPILLSRLSIASEEILMVNILIYLLIFLLIKGGLSQVKLRKMQPQMETLRETLVEGWKFVQEVSAFRFLTLAILGVIICETAIEYHFFVVSDAAFRNADGFQVFFSFFTLARVLIYIGVQSFLTQRIIQRIELKNTFLIEPISSLLGALSSMVLPGLTGGITGILLQKVPQYTVDETARKNLQGLVPEERRGRVSLFIDSYLISAGIIVGAALTGIIVMLGRSLEIPHYSYGYLGIGAIAATVSIISINKMRSVYDSSLLNWRLKRRQRGKSVLDKLDF